MVLVVPPVEVNLLWIDQEEGKEDDEDLEGLFASVHEVAVEHVGLGRGRQAVLQKRGTGGVTKDASPSSPYTSPTSCTFLGECGTSQMRVSIRLQSQPGDTLLLLCEATENQSN